MGKSTRKCCIKGCSNRVTPPQRKCSKHPRKQRASRAIGRMHYVHFDCQVPDGADYFKMARHQECNLAHDPETNLILNAGIQCPHCGQTVGLKARARFTRHELRNGVLIDVLAMNDSVSCPCGARIITCQGECEYPDLFTLNVTADATVGGAA